MAIPNTLSSARPHFDPRLDCGGPSSVNDSVSSASSFPSPSPFAMTPAHLLSDQSPARQLAHASPDVPSTFLPSYYPDGRPGQDFLPSAQSRSRNHLEPYNHAGVSSYSPSLTTHDVPEACRRLPQSGPAARHLLDGVNISSLPRPPRPSAMPTYDLSPGFLSAGLPPTAKPWVQKERAWQEITLFDNANRVFAAYGNENGDGSGNDASGSTSCVRGVRSATTSMPRGGLPDHTPPSSVTRNYSSALSDPLPRSAAYPGMMYGNLSLPDGALPSPSIGVNDNGFFVSGEEYAQALGIYEHLLDAVSHIRPSNASAGHKLRQPFDILLLLASDGISLLSGLPGPHHPTITDSRNGTPASVMGVDLGLRGSVGRVASAAAGGGMLGGIGKHCKRGGVSGDSKKGLTKCLGCGATETPEWRRGPLGPRTLCNACGLVHMKMLRRQKREAEKAQVEALAKSAEVSGAV